MWLSFSTAIVCCSVISCFWLKFQIDRHLQMPGVAHNAWQISELLVLEDEGTPSAQIHERPGVEEERCDTDGIAQQRDEI